MKKILLIFVVIFYTLIISCNNNGNVVSDKVKVDTSYKIIKTTKYITGESKTIFNKQNREGTQFNIDKKSMIEVSKSFSIKISDKEVLIYNDVDKLVKKYTIQKKWVDKLGPSDVYDLKDENNIDCSLDHYISSTTDGKNYLSFRYKKVLENYSN
jgi:hypothetical protein